MRLVVEAVVDLEHDDVDSQRLEPFLDSFFQDRNPCLPGVIRCTPRQRESLDPAAPSSLASAFPPVTVRIIDKHEVIQSRFMHEASKCKPCCCQSGDGIEHFRERRSSPDSQDGSLHRRLQDLVETTFPCPGKPSPKDSSIAAHPSAPGSAQGGSSWPGGNKSAASSIRSLQSLRRSRRMLNSQPRDAALPTHDRGRPRDREEAAVVSLPDGPAMSQPQAAPASETQVRQQGTVQPHLDPEVREDLRRALHQHGGAETTEDLCRRLGRLAPARRAGARRRQRHRRRRVPPGPGLRRQGDRDRPGRGDGRHRPGAGRRSSGSGRHGRLHPGRRARDGVPRAVRHHLEPRRVHAHPGQAAALLPAVHACWRTAGGS